MQLLRYLEENRAVCRCALQSLGRSYISMFFRDDIHAIIHRTVDELHGQAHFLQAPEQGELLTQFYVIALAGVVGELGAGGAEVLGGGAGGLYRPAADRPAAGALDRQKEESLRQEVPQGGLTS